LDTFMGITKEIHDPAIVSVIGIAFRLDPSAGVCQL
jgi:hypothetical protein